MSSQLSELPLLSLDVHSGPDWTMAASSHCEAFNSRFRLECLNQHWFLDIDDAWAKIEAWRQDYNTVRPHGAIGNQVPMDLVRSEMNRISHTPNGPHIR